MKVKKINVPFYKWKIVSLVAESHSDVDQVAKEMKKYKLSDSEITNIREQFSREAFGGGVIYYNDSCLFILLIVYPHTSTKECVSTLLHEGRHAADRIIESIGLEGGESTAYLSEYVTFELIKDYIP